MIFLYRTFISGICAGIVLMMKLKWYNFIPQGAWFDRWTVAHALFGFGLGVFFLDIYISMIAVFGWEIFEIWHDPESWDKYGRNNFVDTILGFVFASIGIGVFG